MTEVDQHANHTFCWNQLAATNVDSAAVFYSALFDCDVDNSDVGADSEMIRLMLRGRHVMGIHLMSEAERYLDHPAYWEAYTRADDLPGLLERVQAHGGQIIDEPSELGDFGWFAQFEDPDGARLCLWTPKAFHGRGWNDAFNAPVWHDLNCIHGEEMQRFYGTVFGWKITPGEDGDAKIWFLSAEDKSIGSIRSIPIQEQERADSTSSGRSPAHWLIYFSVQDLNATVAAAQALDGAVAVEPTELPDGSHHAILVDPQGARFGVIQQLHG